MALHLSLLVYFAIGIAFTLMLFAWLWGTNWPIASRWRFVVRAIPWFAAFFVAEWLCGVLPRWQVAAAGAVVIAVALVWRAVLPGRIESLGLRCRECGATYGNHTAFFHDLDANPRGLTVSDVSRPPRSQPVPLGQDRRAGAGQPPQPSAMSLPRDVCSGSLDYTERSS